VANTIDEFLTCYHLNGASAPSLFGPMLSLDHDSRAPGGKRNRGITRRCAPRPFGADLRVLGNRWLRDHATSAPETTRTNV